MLVIATFDGCSSGYRSHFASELMTKCLISACNLVSLKYADKDIEVDKLLLQRLIAETFDGLKKVANILQIRDLALVSTMVIAVIDTEKKTAHAAFCGDGYIFVDGESTSNPQNNLPDYMAYHVHNMFAYEYAKSSHVVYHQFENISDITVSSDGIDTFNDSSNRPVTDEPVDALIKSKRFEHLDVMLERSYNILKLNGFNHLDDISIVRVIFDEDGKSI